MTDQTTIDVPAATTGRELVPVRSLEERAASINDHINKALRADGAGHRHRLKAGAELMEVRALLPHGEWLPWCKANIYRGIRDVQKLIKLASAPDPEAALEQERAGNRVAKASSRANAPVSRISDEEAEPEPFVKPKFPRGRAFEKLIAAANHADDDYKVAPENRPKYINTLYQEMGEYFCYDLGQRFLAFVKANPDLVPEAVDSLHTMIDSVETECRIMREALYPLSEGYVEAVDQPEPGAVDPEHEPDEPSPLTERERKMALADVEIVGIVAGQPMAQHSAAAATVLRKATKKAGAVIRPDLAAFAAKLGMPVSANAAA